MGGVVRQIHANGRAARRPEHPESGIHLPSVARTGRALHHLIIKQRVPATPGLVIPVLYLFETGPDGEERSVRLEKMVEFLKAYSARSHDWRMQHANAAGMLWDYLIQCGPEHAARSRQTGLNFNRLVMSSFINRLLHGTVSVGKDARIDETGLHWSPRSVTRAKTLAKALIGYGKSITDDSGMPRRPLTASDTPFGVAEFSGFVAVSSNRNSYRLLAHLKTLSKSRTVALHPGIVGRSSRDGRADGTLQFPREYLVPLLRDAYVIRRGHRNTPRVNGPALVATALCALGGLRVSEVFHVWVTDVRMVGKRLEVFLFHPEQAAVEIPGCEVLCRQQYLRMHSLMEPRTSGNAGKYKAGWKGMALNNQHWNIVYPMPLPGMQELMHEILLRYIAVDRPAAMKRRAALGLPDHPFLLVSAGGGGSRPGDPYTMSAFRSAWAGGLNRLSESHGNPSLRVSKRMGMTPHGLRHLYGAVLAELKVAPEFIQRAMRHLSPFSQQRYTAPRCEVVNDALNSAMATSHTDGPGHDFAPLRDVNRLLDDLREPRGSKRW